MAFEITYPEIPQVKAYVGPTGTSKTGRLIEDVRKALAEGADPKRIALLCPLASGVPVFRAKLDRAIGAESGDITITTPRALELAELRTPEAAAWLGREPRMLADFEKLFFLEDMRTTGTKQRRLKEMLKFFFRSITELEDRNPEWLVTGEEESVYQLMQQSLAFGGGLLPAEVSNKAASWLEQAADAREAAQFDHVFAVDYETQNRASQLFIQLIAAQQLVITIDPYNHETAEDPYPYAAGLAELLDSHPDAQMVACDELSQSPHVATMVRNLLSFDCMQEAGGTSSIDTRMKDAAEPAPASDDLCPVTHTEALRAEFATVAELVQARIDGGTDPEQIFVATPNRAWSSQIARALRERGIRSSRVEGRQILNGDIRDAARSRPMRMLTALALAADPASSIAWRCWVGFGDSLGASAGIADLRAWAQGQGATLPQALEALRSGDAPAIAQTRLLIDRSKEAGAYLQRVNGLTGEALVGEAARVCGCDSVPPAMKDLLGVVEEGDTAGKLFARAFHTLIAPVFAPGTVRIGSWPAALGQDINVLVIAGCMNGFTPQSSYFDLSQITIDKKKQEHDKLVHALYALASQAHDELICSTSDFAALEDAERLALSYKRVRLVDGKRIATLEPSIVIGFLNGQDEDE